LKAAAERPRAELKACSRPASNRALAHGSMRRCPPEPGHTHPCQGDRARSRRRSPHRRSRLPSWVIPGRPVEGDGIALNLPGLIVTPVSHIVRNGQLTLSADVTLMCGCPVTRDGAWNAADYEVRALVSLAGGKPTEIPLEFTGPTNRFSGQRNSRQPALMRSQSGRTMRRAAIQA